MRALSGTAAGLAAAVAVLAARGPSMRGAHVLRGAHVAEDASAPLDRIAIHYAPGFDGVALPVWRALFGALPPRVRVEVVVASQGDFARFQALLAEWGIASPLRFHAVVTGGPITTWSRDRFAALATPAPAVLAPPRIEVDIAGRAGDAAAPRAVARALDAPLAVSEIVFEGGDLVATPRHLFVDANLLGRNRGRVRADRAAIEATLARHFSQSIVWLGDAVGEVPEHHIMMYMVPLDERTVAVGDPRAGAALAPAGLDSDPDLAGNIRRFDRAASLLAARGFAVVRLPVVVHPGAGSYVTYTNALFDRDASGRVVYLPTYRLPALDNAARELYQRLGYRVVPIDVSTIYRLNGSLGCLVNVLARRG